MLHLEVFHLLADEVRGEAAGMCWHGLDTIQLSGVLLPCLLQHSQVVPAPAHAAHLLGADAGDGRKRTCSSEVAVQTEEWNIHPESVGTNDVN